MKSFVILSALSLTLAAGDIHYGATIGLKAPQQELKTLVNTKPGTSVAFWGTYPVLPTTRARLNVGYDFYSQFVDYKAFYITTNRTGNWNVNAEALYSLTPHIYAIGGLGVKRWNWDSTMTYTKDLSWMGSRRMVYSANKVFGEVGVGYELKNFAFEATYEVGKISEKQHANSTNVKFVVKL